MPTLDDFSYELPKELIAHSPVVPRDSSKLLLLNRQTGEMHHKHYSDLPEILGANDVLVRNNTKVIPARIFGRKTSASPSHRAARRQAAQDGGGQVEILLTKRLTTGADSEVWECLTKPGLKPHQTVIFANSDLQATCQEITNYTRQISFNKSGTNLFTELTAIGHTPLPPYIEWDRHDEAELRQLYQTTYAKHAGSAAAPTAGLHFTPELDQRLRDAGVQIEEVTLHVGLGTFLRVKVEDVTQHHMHSEVFELKPDVAERLNQAKATGKRIISVGTTTTRVLESCATSPTLNPVPSTLHPAPTTLLPQSGETDIYIYPPYRFKFIDGLITNFHEPQSTLLMLVSSLVSQPNTPHEFSTFAQSSVGKAYQEAQLQKYRFLSFGDGMFIY